MLSVGIIGSGNWGTAIAKIVGENVLRMARCSAVPGCKSPTYRYEKTVKMYVHQEKVDGRNLTDIINEERENVKYLPGIQLPSNILATDDLIDVGKNSDVLIIVLPHQYLARQCEVLKYMVKATAFAVSLCKGLMEVEGDDTPSSSLLLISKFISKQLSIPCHVLMGANIASEVAAGNFCEGTIGCTVDEHSAIIKDLMETSYFRLTVSISAEVVELCGALKNVVALAAGLSDGLGYGENTKAAIIRIGFIEIVKLSKIMFPGQDDSVFMESCGVADLIATCYGGRNRMVAEAFVKEKKHVDVLEKELLGGQKLQGPLTSKKIITLLEECNKIPDFPLFTTIYQIFYEGRPANSLIEAFVEKI